jgi:ribonuclease T2
MLDIMPSGGLVIHEYKLHGTCSGLDPAGYYNLSRQLFRRVRVPERYQNPFETQFVAPREVVGDFMRANPWLRPEMIAVTCGGPGNRLRDAHLRTRMAPRACAERKPARCAAPTRCTCRPCSARRESAVPRDRASYKRDPGLPRPRIIESPGRF